MNQTKIKAEIVGHSLSPQGDELISVLCTFPRIILAEVNTHRMLSKNTSSSRAIPFNKMVESVQNNPFIPIAWQKNHSGMQGTEYLSDTQTFELSSFLLNLSDILNTYDKNSKEYLIKKKELDELIQLFDTILRPYELIEKTLTEWWLFAKDKAIEAASILYVFGITKQLCNRLLEPFMWTTMLITGSKEGWDNFFHLRNPVYEIDLNNLENLKD